MNASLLKRLFRAVSNENQEDLQKIANLIIVDEEKKGHIQLANELKNTLKPSVKTENDAAIFQLKPHTLTLLPKNRRDDSPLTTYLATHQLKHEMILPNNIEERFQRIEKEYAARERLAQYGLKPRKKILLYGPPGCGKTLGAQRLAWNTGLPLFKVRFDSLVSSFLGETAVNLRAIFESASQSPCVLFFDECDSIAKSRNSTQEVGEIKRVVNSFLQFLDDYDSPGLLVAATNLTDALDSAIWRRFDDVFEVPKPGPEELKQLIKMTLSSMRTERFRWQEILLEATGFSGAEIVKASQDAAKQVVLNAQEVVTHEALLQAIRENRGVE